MMWERGTIRGQLVKAIMLTSGLVLFLAATALVAYELVSLRRFMAEHLTSLAHALAENSAGPLAFERHSEAEQVLASLKDEPHFQAAALYDRDGRVFVTFPKGAPSVPAEPRSAGYTFGPGTLEVFHPVEQADNKLGTLYLRSDLGAIREHMLVYGLIALGVVAGSLLAGFIISEKLQQPISRPVMALVQTAQTITQRNDYSVRAQKLGKGELALLTEAFNQMLDKVQESDRALRQASRETEQRAQEAEESRRLLEALMGNINEGITVTGGPPDFPIRRVSRYGLELGGQPDTAFTGINVAQIGDWSVFLPDGVTKPSLEQMPLYRATRLGESVENFELVLKNAAGHSLSILVNAAPIRDSAGEIVAGISSWRDITERKEAEAELRRLKDELELRVERRTAELAATNRELEAFSYSVSHDLRAPLRHISSYVKLLEKDAGPGLNASSREDLQVIGDAAERMGRLIDDLLSLSRVGRASMVEQVVNVRRLVEGARQELTPSTVGRAIEWKIGELPFVRADPNLLRNVMVNLLSNAIKYTRPRNPARIEVASKRAGNEVVIFVRDNGVGFDMGFANKLFGVFQRLHAAEDFEGMGIGLASVRRIIHRHGGRTWAEGEVDRGATFYFSIPVDRLVQATAKVEMADPAKTISSDP